MGGMSGDSDALSDRAGSVLMRPKELGPTIRIPDPRARRTSSAWSSSPPAPPPSPKPALTMSRASTSAAAHSSTTLSTFSAGTAMTARSTWPGTSPIVSYAVRPRIFLALRLTGWASPVKPPSRRFLRKWCPMDCGERPAPMTATVRGRSIRRTLIASARCSRDIATALERSVGSMSKCSATTPSSTLRLTS